ncbi:MAG: DUF1501 domain-containing protein [Planctomycetaceae bacterium]|nr:DUF1501 domain-containing protein [Planctomycetaceae bacterium]
MLKIHFGRKQRNCEGISRRNVLQVSGAGLGALALPGLQGSRALAGQTPQPARKTSVVWLWLNGGPTQIETFDPQMNAPVEFRSVSGEVKTKLPGVTVGGHFGGLAQVADRMAFVRSFEVPTSSHRLGAFWLNTGHAQADDRPSLGSIASRALGPNHPETGMPTYVQMGRVGFGEYANAMTGPSWLGKACGPFTPEGSARENMTLNVELPRLDNRRALLNQLDQFRREADANGVMDGIDGFNQQALNLILGSAPQAFDVKQEDPALVAEYGEGLGESMLAARRLCEAGCGFVCVSYQGWDMHGAIEKNMDRRGPEVDRAVSAFVRDIYQRGLDENILLVVSGEFGRTPRINKKAGRDHWGGLSTLALSGGGLQMGQVVGESTPRAEAVKSGRVTPQDLMATVFHVLGIPQAIHFDEPGGRPVPMLSGGRPIDGLV